MNKTLIIISREYLTRVKKKSFIILTFLLPILMAALIIVPVVIASQSEPVVKVMVVDDNDFFINKFTDTKKTFFSYRSGDIETIKKEALDGDYNAVLHILKGEQALKSNLYFYEDPPMRLCSNLESQMDKVLFDKLLIDSFHVDPVKFEVIKDLTRSSIASIQIDEDGTEKASMTELNKVIGMIAGMIIYFFIFMFAGQVLRGVLEEKGNRIVEVLISSVKPMQLLMGKIIGIALVGLTQFAMWIVFTLVILVGVNIAAPDLFTGDEGEMVVASQQMGNAQMDNNTALSTIDQSSNIFTQISSYFTVSFSQLIICFLFYFLMGYLVYAALFAAAGSAADNETDSQQFNLPVTIPLILTIALIVPISESPSGPLAFWFSMIPLTSPVAMLIRIPSGVPLWELLLSMTLMLLFFVFSVWIAAKIYRTGILMYGKKITYKELWKWIRY